MKLPQPTFSQPLYVAQPTNTLTQFIIQITLLHNCKYDMLQYVSTSVRHQQGANFFLAKLLVCLLL
jgi:hypothetical protein